MWISVGFIFNSQELMWAVVGMQMGWIRGKTMVDPNLALF